MRHSLACVLVCFLLMAPLAAQEAQVQEPVIPWEHGPTVGKLGDIAEITVPEGYRFVGKEGAKRFLEMTENIPSGRELGVLLPESREDGKWWFVTFEFSETGYIRDDERDKLDAAELLKGIQENTEAANKERKKRGWTAFHINGWARPPYYDQSTNNLSWAIRGRGDEASEEDTINFSTRVLGRRGSMDVDLVLAASQFGAVEPEFLGLMKDFRYTQGNRYADFVKGDKVAAYGLTALIAGGAGAAVVKSGLLSKIWKFLVIGIVALAGAAKALFKKLFGAFRNEEQITTDSVPQATNTASTSEREDDYVSRG